jgi:signal transduction histidine kinase
MTPLPKALSDFDLRPYQTNRILVVDDEPEHLTLLQTFLEDDWTVVTALSGDEALSHVRSESFDVVLADQRMPGMSGVELLRHCAELQPDAARVMLTAWSDSAAMIGAINEGRVFRFLQKPWEPHTLHEALRAGVERAAFRRAVQHFVEELSRKNAELEETLRAKQQALNSLLHAERLAAIGQVTSGVVHQIRNHLQVMRALMEEVEEERNLSPSLSAFLELGMQSLEMTFHTLDDVHRFARRQSGPISHRAPADLNQLVRQAVQFARLDRRMRHAGLREDYGDLPQMSVDAGKLRQVVQNLLRNAADALPEEGAQVRVRTERDRQVVRIRVEDNGRGVSPELRRRIWEPFFTTKDRDALGLGLHICREIVAAHGGTIDCEERPGGGACFVVELPLPEL